MPTERRAAALFDGRHDLELAEAEVAGLRVTPSRPVSAEDIRDLQGEASHARGLAGCLDLQVLQWAFHLMQELGRDLAIAGGVLELLVAQQHLDNADILVVLEQVGGEGVAQRMQRDGLVDPGGLACPMQGAIELAGR